MTDPTAARQLPLPFEHVPRYGRDFIRVPANAEAVTWLAQEVAWPQRRLALWGAAGVGKTHLLRLWAAERGAAVIAGPSLVFEPPARPLAIDAAAAADGEALLHVLNAAVEAGMPVLLADRAPPARWPAPLPDLASRLRAMTAVEIAPPDDDLLRALLSRLLAERQLAVDETAQEWLLHRLPRTAAAIREAAGLLDATMLGVRGQPRGAALAPIVAAITGDAAECEGEDRPGFPAA